MREFFLYNDNIKLNIITHNIINPSCVLIHLHGIGSNFQYDTLTNNDFENRINFFKKLNILSYGLEFRGHGKSDGKRCYIKNFDELVEDFMTLYRYVHCIYSSKKIFVVAESMGGCVILKSCLKYKLDLAGVILLAPLCGVNEDLLPSESIVKLVLKMSYYFPSYKAIGTKNMDEGCSNPKYNLLKTLNKYEYKGKFRLSTSRECYLSSQWVFNNKHRFNLPILGIHSKSDKVTSYKKTIQFIEQSSSKDTELFILDEGNHTLLVPLYNEDYQPIIILSKIINWINNRI